MNCESRIRRTVVLLLLVGVAAGSPLHGQASPESVLMLSEDTITWWIVDRQEGGLNDEQRELIRDHPRRGVEIVKSIRSIRA